MKLTTQERIMDLIAQRENQGFPGATKAQIATCGSEGLLTQTQVRKYMQALMSACKVKPDGKGHYCLVKGKEK